VNVPLFSSPQSGVTYLVHPLLVFPDTDTPQ
jgi:hypothetical protein